MVTEFLAGVGLGGIAGYAARKDGQLVPVNYNQVAQFLESAKPKLMEPIKIDTSVARTDPLEYREGGILLYVHNPATPSGSVYIRLNEPDAPELDLTTLRMIKGPFYRFFIRNAAGTGTLELSVSKAFQIELAPGEIDTAIQSSTIAVPVDVQMAYIMMPVDIQAQYVTLDIDIVAQTVGNIAIDVAAQSVGSIDINLAASAITLDINIKSITGGVTFAIGSVSGTVDIKIASAQSVGVWVQAEWAALQGQHKTFVVADVNVASGGSDYSEYTIPTGKVLYITAFAGTIFATNEADRDKNQICYGIIWNQGGGTAIFAIGGNGGFGTSFPTPIKIVAGTVVRFTVCNYSGHLCTIGATAIGYEL